MKEWVKKIEDGDELSPISLWNTTAGRSQKLTTPTIILGVKYTRGCQSGKMLKVRSTSGMVMFLDSEWFQEPTIEVMKGNH